MAEYELEIAGTQYGGDTQDHAQHRVLYTGIPRLDIGLKGFHPSEVALVECGDKFIGAVTTELCVRAVGNCEHETVFVDGGNSLDPYGIAAICKRKGFDRNRVLSMITVSRAFTAYQMAELVIRKLPMIVEKTNPSVILVSCMFDLFLDKDMPPGESIQLVRRCMASLKETTVRNDIITVVTNSRRSAARCGFRLQKIINNMPDKAITLDDRMLALTFLPPRPRIELNLASLPRGQTALDGFFGR